MDVKKALAALRGVVQTSPQTWKAHCPAHEDANPSLSITQQPGRILIHCHAGCSFEEVIKAAGISPEDLREKGVRERRAIEATYNYHDERGALIFQVCRCTDKHFFQRRLGENGEWVNNLSGVTRTIYRLPELTQARGTRVVFLVEGEKDVDRLFSVGFLATCNPGGAGKWKQTYAKHLKGRHVVVIPDNDAPGKDHAKAAVQTLRGVAASVRLLDLPGGKPHGDVSSWLCQDHDAAELKQLVAKTAPMDEEPTASPSAVTAIDLLKMQLPPIRYVVPGLLPEGLALLVGRPKVGKSWLCLDLAIAVASGGRVLGKIAVEPHEVLYLALEDNLRRLQSRLTTLLQGEPPPIGLHLNIQWPRLDPDSGGLLQLLAWIRTHPDCGLIIIDTLARIKAKGDTRSQAYDLDTEALTGLQNLAGQNALSIVVVHHTRKAVAEDPLDLVSGTLALTGVADSTLLLKRASTRAAAELYIVGRDIDQQNLALAWGKEFPSWTLLGNADDYALSEQRQQVKDLLRSADGPLSPSNIATALDLPLPNVNKLLKRMLSNSDIRKIDRGKYVDQDNDARDNSNPTLL